MGEIVSNVIKIKDLYSMYRGNTFELFIKKRSAFKGYTKLLILVNKSEYEIWEPKNSVWVNFRTRVGMGLVCKIESYKDALFMKPIQQLIMLAKSDIVLDLFELPFENGEELSLGVGLVTSRNKTQYMIVMNKKYGSNLIRIPTDWEHDIDTLQYIGIKVKYKRTAQKGFLTMVEKGNKLNVEQIDRLFKGRK